MPVEGALEPHTCWRDDHVGKLAPTEVCEANLEVGVCVPLEIDRPATRREGDRHTDCAKSVFFSSAMTPLVPQFLHRLTFSRKWP